MNIIGKAVFSDEQTLDFFVEKKLDFDIIFPENGNIINGKVPHEFIRKEEICDYPVMNGSILQSVKKKILVGKYFFQRKDSEQWFVSDVK